MVSCDAQGGYLRSGNFRRDSFAHICRRTGLPVYKPKKSEKGKKEKAAQTSVGEAIVCGEGRRLYGLRHTCATLLMPADVPAKVVSEQLGHGSISLALDNYSYVLSTMQKRAADVFDLLLGCQERRKAEGG